MEKKIESIVIIGAGNVASHLATTFSRKIDIVGIYSKSGESSKILASKLNCPHIEYINQLPPCDLVLICVNDSSINALISKIPEHFNIAYTSGSIELDLSSTRENYGVFYPLQTFSKDKELDISNIPFFIEATNEIFSKQLFDLASRLSSQVTFASSLDRKKLHISAVFVNNFINHLAYIAKEFTENNHLNWEHLKPLMMETIHKIITSTPKEAQTGPARRNDIQIINEHLSMLNDYPKEIYKIISDSIINTYSKTNNND